MFKKWAFVSHFIFNGVVLGVCLLASIPAHSYTLTQSGNGNFVRWSHGQKYFVSGNPNNQAGISQSGFWNAIVHGLQQWSYATNKLFDFEYWQGTNSNIHSPSQKLDGLNSIFFASNSTAKVDRNVIGYTQVWYSENGNLIEADIILNDRDFQLTDNPKDTSINGRGVYLNNVVTHELGHAIGLSHSSSINSSMLFQEFSEQYKLGCDDLAAAKHLYPKNNDEVGSIDGTILSPTNEPISGAVVTAISSKRGIPIASVHTDQNGKFQFGALEPGPYSITFEKYFGSESSIPPNYRAKQNHICMGNQFPKNFITETDKHTLKRFIVSKNFLNDIGTYRIDCNGIQESTPYFEQNATHQFVDKSEPGSTKTYTFMANGPFRVTAIGYLLLSPVKVELSLLSNGQVINPRRGGPTYRSKISDFNSHDSSLSAEAYGPVTIAATVTDNRHSYFPGDAKVGNENLFMVHIHDETEARNGKFIPLNARCNSNLNFPEYRSPPGNPIRNATTTTMRDQVGFCGNANAGSLHGNKQTHSSPLPLDLGALIGWFLPFLVAIVCRLYLKTLHAKMKE